MIVLAGTQPTQYSAVCAMCGAREGPIVGAREDVVEHLTRRSWRVDERYTKSATCPKCAGPPSVFPAARAVGDPMQCSDCRRDVERCVACDDSLALDDAISCRRSFGHAHARCATQRLPKFEPLAG